MLPLVRGCSSLSCDSFCDLHVDHVVFVLVSCCQARLSQLKQEIEDEGGHRLGHWALADRVGEGVPGSSSCAAILGKQNSKHFRIVQNSSTVHVVFKLRSLKKSVSI
jgi:hypothetical protein